MPEGRRMLSEAEQAADARAALGRQLAACRRSAGMSQERLAALADYSRSTIANVETGRQHVSRSFWAQCDSLLTTGGALSRSYGEVEAAERAERAQAAALARYHSLAVTFGKPADAPGPITGGQREDSTAGPDIPAATGRAAPDPQIIAYLGEALVGHARAAGMFGGADLVPLMVRHVSLLRAGLASARGRDREQLTGVSARYGEFPGWLCQDLGRPGDALFWPDRALAWAREAGDPAFVSYVLMRQSDLAEERGPAGKVLALARAAERAGRLGPRARALVVQQEAVACAQAGDTSGFEQRVEQAREYVAAAAGSDDAPWGLYCTPAYVTMQEATGWMRLHQPGKAVTLFEREITGLPAGDYVDAGLFRARLAHAYALDGQAGNAAEAALKSWDLACTTGSSRTFRELTQVRKKIGRAPQTTTAARFAAVFDARARQSRTAAKGGLSD